MSNILIRIEDVLEARSGVSTDNCFGLPYDNSKSFALSIAALGMTPVYFSSVHPESEIEQWLSYNMFPEGKIISCKRSAQDHNQSIIKQLNRYHCTVGIGRTSEDNQIHRKLDCISCIIAPEDPESWNEVLESIQHIANNGTMLIHPIGFIECDFQEKFGIPRQNGIIPALEGKVILAPEYRSEDAFRELDSFSHVWLVWQFSQALNDTYNLTVRPPRMGGNTRVGVFASRAPYRPNHLALSCVRLEEIVREKGKVAFLRVSGIDMMNRTPIYDIKPYIPFSDCKMDATEGYTAFTRKHYLDVLIPEEVRKTIPSELCENLREILLLDPRPGYIGFGARLFHMNYAGYNVTFYAQEGQIIVSSVDPINNVIARS